MVEDILKGKLKLVICGTARGTISARTGHYYSNRGNKFWKTLARTGIVPREFKPEEAPLLLKHGVGLTDLITEQSGSDKTLRFLDHDSALRMKILKFKPKVLCFNGKRAAKEALRLSNVEYGMFQNKIGSTDVYIAPSTSGSAGRWWDESLWHKLAAELVRGI